MQDLRESLILKKCVGISVCGQNHFLSRKASEAIIDFLCAMYLQCQMSAAMRKAKKRERKIARARTCL